MSPIALGLDLILGVLLIAALGVGLRLNARLKTLQAGQAGFVKAAIELNQAAARADAGLTALRAAAEQVHDELLSRIETARQLSARLESAGERIPLAAVPTLTAPKPEVRTPASSGAQADDGEPTVRVRNAPAPPIRFTPRPVKSAIRDMDDDLFEAPAGRASR